MDAPHKLEFPCDYPIKVMLREQGGVREAILIVVDRHAGAEAAAGHTERCSAQANFSSLTFTIRATGPAHIEAIFLDLKTIPGVVLVL